MSCPTCSHTMQQIMPNSERFVFWCPRCGTIMTHWRNETTKDIEAPKIVRYATDVLESHGGKAIEMLPYGTVQALKEATGRK